MNIITAGASRSWGTQHRAPRPRSFTEVEPVSKPRNKGYQMAEVTWLSSRLPLRIERLHLEPSRQRTGDSLGKGPWGRNGVFTSCPQCYSTAFSSSQSLTLPLNRAMTPLTQSVGEHPTRAVHKLKFSSLNSKALSNLLFTVFFVEDLLDLLLQKWHFFVHGCVLHMYADMHTCLCVHIVCACGGRRLVSGIILDGSSALFTEVGCLSQTHKMPILPVNQLGPLPRLELQAG